MSCAVFVALQLKVNLQSSTAREKTRRKLFLWQLVKTRLEAQMILEILRSAAAHVTQIAIPFILQREFATAFKLLFRHSMSQNRSLLL